ncbi:MAG TPA: hypothetical protein VK508_11185 [Cyclobacteriaceae bacterium]|nr:hypothetical protein [Cyclobacteriaceae bacterium]
MKTVSLILRSAAAVCFAFVMSSASCDLFDKVDDVTIDVTLEHTFHVDEKLDADNVAYLDFEILDAADVNSDFAKYKDKIKSISVSSVTYEVQNHTVGTGTIFTNGKIGYSPANATSVSVVAALSVANIKAAEGQVLNLPFQQAGLDEIGNLLKNDKTVGLYLIGTFSETPVKFDVKVKLKCAMTADAL